VLLMDGLEVQNSKPCSALCAGAVVLPVPHFDDMGHGNEGEEAAQVASPPASGALPSAPPLDI
jgi:hypothetical protein